MLLDRLHIPGIYRNNLAIYFELPVEMTPLTTPTKHVAYTQVLGHI